MPGWCCPINSHRLADHVLIWAIRNYTAVPVAAPCWCLISQRLNLDSTGSFGMQSHTAVE
jgi:hypothetical protein